MRFYGLLSLWRHIPSGKKGAYCSINHTQLLVQIFFIYNVIAPVLGIGRFTAAVLALSLFEGAYASEIFRAGFVSIHKGQWQAAHSLGLHLQMGYIAAGHQTDFASAGRTVYFAGKGTRS